MTQEKKEPEPLQKAHWDLIVNKSSSLVKRALDDLARLKALPPSGSGHSVDLQKKRQVRVVIGNGQENINELFSELIKEVIKDKYALTIQSVFYGEELLKIAVNHDADIFIVIVNNIRFHPLYPPKERIEQSLQLIKQIKIGSDKPMIVFSPAWIELEGGISMSLEERVRQIGADFYFQFYDAFDDDFKTAFEKCMYQVLRRAS